MDQNLEKLIHMSRGEKMINMSTDLNPLNKENKKDVVNHPKHYCREGAMECFDEFMLIYGIEAAKYACLFNIHKYRYRAADKNGEEDLKKSDWYMNKYKELCEIKTKNTVNKDDDPDWVAAYQNSANRLYGQK